MNSCYVRELATLLREEVDFLAAIHLSRPRSDACDLWHRVVGKAEVCVNPVNAVERYLYRLPSSCVSIWRCGADNTYCRDKSGSNNLVTNFAMRD